MPSLSKLIFQARTAAAAAAGYFEATQTRAQGKAVWRVYSTVCGIGKLSNAPSLLFFFFFFFALVYLPFWLFLLLGNLTNSSTLSPTPANKRYGTLWFFR